MAKADASGEKVSPLLRRSALLTYTGRNMGTTLLIATSTSVAGESRHAVLARTLAGGVVAGLSGGANGMTFAGCN